MKAYLDSNVLINFTWWWYSKRRKEGREVAKLARAIETTAFEPVISKYCLWELANHFRDYEISKLVIKDGYSYHEFSRLRKTYNLSNQAVRRVRERVRRFETNPYMSLIAVTGLSEQSLEEIAEFVDADIQIVDAFHLQAAISYGCDFLVTGDSEFKHRVEQMCAQDERTLPTRLIPLREFLELASIRLALRDEGP